MAEIYATARDLYLEQGLSGLTMRRVAARVGLTPTAIYRHFKNKGDLLAKVTEEGFRLFASYLYRALEGETAEERLYLSGRQYLNFALEHPKYYEIVFMFPRELRDDDSRTEEERRRNNVTFRFLADRVRECMESGFIERGDPEEIALTIWAHSHGLVSGYLAGRITSSEEDFRALWKRSHRQLLHGIAARKTPKS